ncbi:hypothetical protein [Arenibaculum pallidiluteum]|uniref:hypothetical protein n=1 Tax=Arenibaculum pallidiluteum TaxID=2812559 RepID=UPI001A977791|nr:hypothetical protein [Arenibaculum pallidiluteum]
MSPSDERREMEDKPVGERPQDVRSRPEVIMERDAKHLADEAEYDTAGIDDADGTADESTRTGSAGGRRIKAQTPDGKPYADSQDPDGRFDGVSNTGSGSLD